MVFLIYSKLFVIIEEQSMENNIMMLRQAKDTMDTNMIEFVQIVSQREKNQRLNPYSLNPEGFSGYQSMSEIENHIKANMLIRELGIFIKGKKEIYTSRGVYTVDSFYKDYFNYSKWSHEDFIKTLNTIETPYLRHSEEVAVNSYYNKINIVTLMFPYSIYNPFATAIFIIDEKNIINMVKNSMQDDTEFFYITDGNGKVIASSKNIEADKIIEQYLLKYKSDKNREGYYFLEDKNNNQYMVSYVKSNINNWNYIIITPKEKILFRVYNARIITIYAVIIIFLSGAAMIYFMMRINYNPLKIIRRNLELFLAGDYTNEDDVNLIKSTISKMITDNDRLKNKIERNKKLVRDQFLMRLLEGMPDDKNNLDVSMVDCGVILGYTLFGVAAVTWNENVNSVTADIIEVFEKVSNQDLAVYGVNVLSTNSVVLILNYNSEPYEDPTNRIIDCLNPVKKTCKEQHGITITIGIGNMYNDMAYISKSYIEACSSLDYRLVKGNGCTIFFNEIGNHITQILWYPGDMIGELVKLLKQGNSESVTNLLKEIFESLIRENIPLYLARCYCFDIINSVIKVMYDLNISFNSITEGKPDILNIVKFDTIYQLNNMIENLCISVCNYIRTTRESGNLGLKDEVEQYILANFKDANFSIKNLSKSLGLNQSYLSRYYKDQTGLSIIDYVTALRMKEIKQLLGSTDKNVKEIVKDAGYVDLSNFNRRFRELEGISPLEYRKLVKK